MAKFNDSYICAAIAAGIAAALLANSASAQQRRAPAAWITNGIAYERTRLAWSTPGLQDVLNYGYVVCNADRANKILLHYKSNDIHEKEIGPRECFGVDSPSRLDLMVPKGAPSKVPGLYQTYRWGSFGMGNLKGVTFPLSEDNSIKPPVRSARVHGLSAPRETNISCERVPSDWEAAQDFSSHCKLPLTRLANYRICLPDDSTGDTTATPAGALRLVTDESVLKDRQRLFHSIVTPGSCIDIHEERQAWILVSKKGADGFDPARIGTLKVRVQTIAK